MHSGGVAFQDEEVLDVLTDVFVKELIATGGGRKERLRHHAAGLSVNPQLRAPAVALFELSGPYEDEQEKRSCTALLRQELRRLAADGCAVFTEEDGRVGLLFPWEARGWLAEIQAELGGRLSRPLTIGTGEPCGELAAVHRSYSQAAQALQLKFYRGAGHMIEFGGVAEFAAPPVYPEAQEKLMAEAVRSGHNGAAIEAAVDAFYDALLQGGPIGIKHVQEMTIRSLVGIEKTLRAEAEPAAAFPHYDIMSVLQLETLAETKRCVGRYLLGLRDALLTPHGKDIHRSVIKMTIQCMEQEYENATLASVARKVYMAPTYLSLIFKSYTGKTFIDKLIDIRIDKAKEMLKSTLLKNYEVAGKVGYQDSRYFSQIFKKKVGVSPSEYRKLACR